MHLIWINWMMNIHEFDTKDRITDWGFNLETQLRWCDYFVQTLNKEDTSCT